MESTLLTSSVLLTPSTPTCSSSPLHNVSFTHILGQGRVNQLGGVFINGRPLPNKTRIQIIQMATSGIRPCQISRELRVSHGAVSKILNRYAETGSIFPGQMGGTRTRMSVHTLEDKISTFQEENPHASASDIQAILVANDLCTKSTAPSVSSIARYMRSRSNCTSIGPIRKYRISHSIDSILGTSSDESKSPSSSDEDCAETRRNRTNFTGDQINILEAAFKENSYPDPATRDKLAKETALNDEKIMTWFSNRRARCRKSIPFIQQLLLQQGIEQQNTIGSFSSPDSSFSPSSIPPSPNCLPFLFHPGLLTPIDPIKFVI